MACGEFQQLVKFVGEKQPSARRARRQRGRAMTGYVVTWDVDSADRARCNRLRRFVFGQSLQRSGRSYRYPGFIEREGVRYLGQSVLFVTHGRLLEFQAFLRQNGIAHVVTQASLGPTAAG